MNQASSGNTVDIKLKFLFKNITKEAILVDSGASTCIISKTLLKLGYNVDCPSWLIVMEQELDR